MLGLFESEETKAWNAYKARTKGMSRVTKEKFLARHFPKKKVPDDSEERYTTTRTAAVESGLRGNVDEKMIRRLRGQK